MIDIDTRFSQLEKRIQRLEKTIFNTKNTVTNKTNNQIESSIVKKIDDFSMPDLIIMSLKLNEKQTKDDIQKTLQDWGKVFNNWLSGGNFNNRLLKTNIVKVIEKGEKGTNIFSLTQKGDLEANKLIEKIKKLKEK